MRAVVQRISEAHVEVAGRCVGKSGPGLLLLVGVHRDDLELHAEKLADKVAHLRIFSDADGKMNLAITDIPSSLGGFERSVLAVSNFTVYGDTKKNRRPSFVESASFEVGKRLFEHFVERLRAMDIATETGEFGADMAVSLVNDGPVTVILDV